MQRQRSISYSEVNLLVYSLRLNLVRLNDLAATSPQPRRTFIRLHSRQGKYAEYLRGTRLCLIAIHFAIGNKNSLLTSSMATGISTKVSSEGEESLCFTAAATKKINNEISTQAYLESILAHCCGVRHGNNKRCNDDAGDGADPDKHESTYSSKLLHLDHFAWRLRTWALKLEPISGTKPSF